MQTTPLPSQRFSGGRPILQRGLLCFLLGALALTGTSLFAAGPTAAPAPSEPKEDFGLYLIQHQSDLEPFFKSHTETLTAAAIPLFFEVMSLVLFLNLVLGWIIDVAAGRGFSIFYSPTRAKIMPAILYGTARMFLVIVLTLFGLFISLFVGFLHSPGALSFFLALIFLVDVVLEAVLVSMVYRTSIVVSVLFYLGLLVIHSILGVALTGPLVESRVLHLITAFVDREITPELKQYTETSKHDLAHITADRDKLKAETHDLQDRLDRATSDISRLRQQIDDKKNSETYLFSRIAQTRANGDLQGARSQLNAFLGRFPNGTFAGAAKAQLSQLEFDLAARQAQEAQDTANTAKATAEARADLLARAQRGEVSLSEMRGVLIGKQREDVKALLGDPTVIASDRWGYAAQMVYNPMTGEKHGLGIYFLEGMVQSIDYYDEPRR